MYSIIITSVNYWFRSPLVKGINQNIFFFILKYPINYIKLEFNTSVHTKTITKHIFNLTFTGINSNYRLTNLGKITITNN